MGWKLEDGTPVTVEELAEEITRVPRTRFWRMTYMVFLWPEEADPAKPDETDGFYSGFVLELVAIEGAIKWVIQPVAGDKSARVEGLAPVGRKAVEAAMAKMEELAATRRAIRQR